MKKFLRFCICPITFIVIGIILIVHYGCTYEGIQLIVFGLIIFFIVYLTDIFKKFLNWKGKDKKC